MLRKLVLLICLLMAAIPATMRADGPVVTATHVWIHRTTADSNVLFGYMTLENHSGQAIALEHISSTDFASVVIKHAAQSDDKSEKSATPLRVTAHGTLSLSQDHDYLVLSKPS